MGRWRRAAPPRTSKLVRLLAAFWLGVVVPADGQERPAATQERFGEYTVYYSAVRADELPSEELRAYRLPANERTVLLNVAVTVDGKNVPARVEARMIDLAQQVRSIPMREDESNGEIAYLGVARIEDPEDTLTFELEISLPSVERPFRVRFRQSFESVPGPSTEASERGVESLGREEAPREAQEEAQEEAFEEARREALEQRGQEPPRQEQ
jgi:hypothetical protein